MARTYKYFDKEINYRDAQREAKSLQGRAGISNQERKKLGLKHVGWDNLIHAIKHYCETLQSFSGLTTEQKAKLGSSNPELLEAIEEFAAAAKVFEEDLASLSKEIGTPKYHVDGNLLVIDRGD